MEKQNKFLATIITFACLNSFLGKIPASAQIIPDETLGTERSLITPTAEGAFISGGATRGQNQFHSFQDFDITTGQAAYFIGADGLERIFARITGSSPSSIFGSLGVLSTGTDLLLINSNGLVFGPDSALDLTGSFIGTTANSVQFQDGITLLTSEATLAPVLTSSVPTRLNFNQNASISVQNTGHSYSISPFAPIQEIAPRTGLAISPSQTFALIGGSLNLDGGIVRTGGQIQLASVVNGSVPIDSTDWSFDFSDVDRYGELVLSDLSLLQAEGDFGGNISLVGQDINIEDGSFVFNQSILGSSIGDIYLSASNSVNISGGNPIQGATSTILSRQVGTGKGGSVIISAPSFTLLEGSRLLSDTISSGEAGDIKLDIANTTEIGGFDPTVNSFLSAIATGTFGTGNAGNIQLSTNRLRIFSGGSVGSSTYSSGDGGSVVIDANEIVVEGAVPTNLAPAAISVISFSLGDAGRIEINTDSLQVLDGGRVSASTASSGNAGDVRIRATQSVEVSGYFPGARNPSLIDSSANIADPSLAAILQLQYPLEGDAGSVDISSPRLTVRNGGMLTVQNEGSGNAGILTISSDFIQLGSSGTISASTNGGVGGNIAIASDNLLLENSSVTASTVGLGQGGNIFIDSDGIALLSDSSITANAEQAAGGRVEISSDALLRSPDSRITATSAAGPELAGVVDIQAPDETPRTDSQIAPDVVEVPDIAAVCSGGAGESEFIITGRGGLPRSPSSIQQSYSGWQSPLSTSATPEPNRTPQVTQAQGWVFNGDGTVSLTAQLPNAANSARRTACVSESQNRS